MPTTADKYQARLESDRERQKRYYEKHAAKIAERRKRKREECRTCHDKVSELEKELSASQQAAAEAREAVAQAEAAPQPKKRGRPAKRGIEVMTKEQVIAGLQELDINQSTKTNYIGGIRRFFEITGCNDFNKCLKNPREIIHAIDTATKRDGELYSINTKKSLVQAILYVIDHVPDVEVPKETKQAYKDKFEALKIQSQEQANSRVEGEEVPVFTEYIKKVKDKFGVESKEYLLAKIYHEMTIRDNLDVKLVSQNKNLDEGRNWLVIPRSGRAKFIINQYKTAKKYGAIEHLATKPLTELLRKYVAKNGRKMGDTLFTSAKQSDFVSRMNAALGYTKSRGINMFRHMKVTEEMRSSDLTPAQRVELAKKLRHSPIVQLTYVRKLDTSASEMERIDGDDDE